MVNCKLANVSKSEFSAQKITWKYGFLKEKIYLTDILAPNILNRAF